jgi:hypothetical protein
VIGDTFAALALAGAGLVGAVASVFVSINITFHIYSNPVFIFRLWF